MSFDFDYVNTCTNATKAMTGKTAGPWPQSMSLTV